MIWDMLVIWCFVIGFATASPTCTDEEGLKCIPGDTEGPKYLEDTWPPDEASLNEVCSYVVKELECEIEFGYRCPNTVFGLYLEGLKRHKGLYRKLCDKSNEFRAEYLKHVSCVNEQVLSLGNRCHDHMDLFKPDFTCLRGTHGYKNCVEDIVKGACEDDAVKVFDTIYSPRLPIHEVVCQKLYDVLKDLGMIP